MLLSKHILFPWIFIGIIPWMIFSCHEAGDIGSSFNPDSSVEVIALDTFTLFTSTVKVDSIISSGTGRLLAGSYFDERLGRISSRTYFQIGIPSETEVLASAVFDSLTLILPYTYYSGDTLSAQKLTVHTLSEALEFRDDESAFYNVSQLSFAQAPIAAYTFMPRPNRKAPLRIRLPDYLGANWLYLIKNDDVLFQELDNFLDEFPGLVLHPDTLTGSCMLGFRANGTTTEETEEEGTFIRLYYHEQGEDKYLDFPLTNSSLQFNQFFYDKTNPTMAALSTQRATLSSEETSRETYLQAGIGLVSRVEIPYLETIRELGKTSVTMYAELILRPVNHTYDYPRLPGSFLTYQSDHLNRFSEQLDWSYLLSLDTEFDEATYYKVDVTDLVLADIEQDEYQENVLLLALPQFSYSTDRLVMGGARHPNNPIQLRVIITRFY